MTIRNWNDFKRVKNTNKSLCKREIKVGLNGINDSLYNTYGCPIYRVWRDMHHRCGIAKNYKDCTICKEWNSFNIFRVWYEKYWEYDYVIDKDLLIDGNKHYSPDTARMIPRWVNSLFAYSKKEKDTPRGVTYRKDRGKYQARITIYREKTNLGFFNTAKEAECKYLFSKAFAILDYADNDDMPNFLKEPLRIKAELIFNKYQKIKNELSNKL